MDDDDGVANSTYYSGVRHKKTQGTLALTDEELRYPASHLAVAWSDVSKHQVSPASYPKCLLKLILKSPYGGGSSGGNGNAEPHDGGTAIPTSSASSSSSSSLTFQMQTREDLERIRRDVTERLQALAGRESPGASPSASSSGRRRDSKKRSFEDMNSDGGGGGGDDNNKSTPRTFGVLDPVSTAVTRSALLASDPQLRQQHRFLVMETQTVTEEDFWESHRAEVEDESARLAGVARPGTSSLLRSHLPVHAGKVTLGVEEMRQIFLLYPAVHRAYEDKVPLELSDEQFWRKYLESEFFHRDRGRIGMLAREHGASAENDRASKTTSKAAAGGAGVGSSTAASSAGPSLEEQDARAAAVGADDMFSRYDRKLREQQERAGGARGSVSGKVLGRDLAVGQFDLASTLATDRGKLLEGPRDYAPPNATAGDLGSRVIQKYNRHWAMVLHPEEAVAGADWVQVARKSIKDALPEEAQAGGGIVEEMDRLVRYANAAEEDANHALGLGVDDAEYETLSLKNVEAYYSGSLRPKGSAPGGSDAEVEAAKRHAVFARSMVQKSEALLATLEPSTAPSGSQLPRSCFPPPELGRQLLSALTKKMAQDSKSEAVSVELAQKLPEDFRKSLHSYFRRSSELLRHFFGLRKLQEEVALAAEAEAADAKMADAAPSSGPLNSSSSPASSLLSPVYGEKLSRIVRGMETFYREMEGMRKALPQTETGETMRKMCLPIMDQLDWAFQLHREGARSRGPGGAVGGGFVAVDEN
jgi:transcription initiation factor TFIIH subunit 1